MKNTWMHKHEGKEIKRRYPIGTQIKVFNIVGRVEYDAIVVDYTGQKKWYLFVELENGQRFPVTAEKTHNDAHYLFNTGYF